MMIMKRLHDSWEFLANCIKFLNNNPSLIVLPLTSLIFTLITLISIFYVSLTNLNNLIQFSQNFKVASIISLITAYFLFSFVIVYLNAALVQCVTSRLRGDSMSIFKALSVTLKKTGALFQWTLISATICLILNSLEKLHSTIADILSLIFGFSWAVTTYFVMPIMINENIGPIQAFKHSIQLIGKGWRKLLSVNFVLFLFIIAIVALFYAISYLLGYQHQEVHIHFGIVAIFFIAYLLISKSFNTIFNCALYLCISGQKVHGFSDDFIKRVLHSAQK
jgi:Family of unknown function (DUF6159)